MHLGNFCRQHDLAVFLHVCADFVLSLVLGYYIFCGRSTVFMAHTLYYCAIYVFFYAELRTRIVNNT